MKIFKLPDLGEGLQEAQIVEWQVAVGDEVKADQIMVSVETAKAVVDIPAPYAGKIVRLFGMPGQVAHLGAPLVGFEGEDAAAQSTSVVGRMEATDRVLEGPGSPAPAAAGIKAAPAVRALARSLGVDLAVVVPSGPEGSITTADVEQAAKNITGLPPLAPLSGVARTMAQSMTRAHAEVAAATVMDDADIESWASEQRILSRLVRALIAGVHAEPALNAWYDARLGGVHRFEQIDLGLAVDTSDGLLVPVLRGVQQFLGPDLDQALARLIDAAHARKVPSQDLRGCSITLSNFGSIAGRYATPVVVPPSVAILGAGRVRDEVVARNRQPVVRRILPLSLSFDHRCVTGAQAARFLAAVISDLQSVQ